MVIGALPFSFVMAVMAIALVKAIYYDTLREKAGVPTTYDNIEGATGHGLSSGLGEQSIFGNYERGALPLQRPFLCVLTMLSAWH